MNKIFSFTWLNPSANFKLTEALTVFARPKTKVAFIPKDQVRKVDRAYNYMIVERKTGTISRIENLILSQPNQSIAISRFETLARPIGFKKFEAGQFVVKFPHVFEIFEHPVQRVLYLRLTRKALLQRQQEKTALIAQLPDAVTRLRKLLMLTRKGRISLERVRSARKAFGLPDDFESSVVLKYPQYFRLFDARNPINKYIGAVDRDPSLAVCAIDRAREREYRRRGADAESIRFSFIVKYPRDFEFTKQHRIAMWEWQRQPYWSPYEDVSGYDMRSYQAQRQMTKRMVATIHEILSLTVEKRLNLEKLGNFRRDMDLPHEIKAFLLRQQGIFYVHTREGVKKFDTVFLKEAYWKGELVEPNDLYLARRGLHELVWLCERSEVHADHMVAGYRRIEEDEDVAAMRRERAQGIAARGLQSSYMDGDGVSEGRDGDCSASDGESC